MVKKYCKECCEEYNTNERYCMICSHLLDNITSTNTTNTNTTNTTANNNNNNNFNPLEITNNNNNNNNNNEQNINSLLSSLVDIFGIDFQNEILNYITNNNNNNLQLSEEYILNLGKIEVENKMIIFYNCIITIGPLKINGISSNFSLLPFETLNNLNIIEANPKHGETDLIINNSNNNDNDDNNVIFFERGVVSFYTKALRAQNIGAKAVIISQNNDKWPFIMTDSTQSSIEQPIIIPVIMISQTDGKLLSKYLQQSNNKNISNSNNISIQCEILERECIICQEQFQCGEIILKLQCCHLYHEHCLMRWLKNAPTCPLCRLQLPTEKKVSVRNPTNDSQQQQQQQQPQQQHNLNYFV